MNAVLPVKAVVKDTETVKGGGVFATTPLPLGS
jgi:hypothetical protein